MRNRINAGLLAATAGVGLLAAWAPGALADDAGRENSRRRGPSTRSTDRTNDGGTPFQFPERPSRRTGSPDQSQYGGPSRGDTSQFQVGGRWSKGGNQVGGRWSKGGSSGDSTSQFQVGGRWSKGGYRGNDGSSGDSPSQGQVGGRRNKGGWGKGGYSGSDPSQSQTGQYSGHRSRRGTEREREPRSRRGTERERERD
jgi:hypothetical protein